MATPLTFTLEAFTLCPAGYEELNEYEIPDIAKKRPSLPSRMLTEFSNAYIKVCPLIFIVPK